MNCGFDTGLHFVHRQVKTDNARRRDNNVVGFATEFARGDFRHAFGVTQTLFARAGVGAAGIGNDSVSSARGDNAFADLNGSRRDEVFSEDARNGRFAFAVNDRNVEVAVLFDACAHAGCFETFRVSDARNSMIFAEHVCCLR